ncbi:transcription factor TFIIIB component B'' homolog [Fundulus heteroclitus]|uniref:transcription factor TFIIIB component B'' homolog n=1 Tax=Fundulus heteroclitus TaxID=8078 RepID=UPI00165A2801|nr:transcription factor TFIIIB component B'' homolog [Fundulus heteroclitus]
MIHCGLFIQQSRILLEQVEMFRRSRFSVRPNVGTVGRTAAATSQEPPAANQDASKTQKEPNESNDAPQANKSDGTLSENAPGAGDGKDQNGEGTSTSASVQRRKRFSIKPRVAPGRPPTLSRTPKSPVKAVSAAPVDHGCSEPDLEKPSTSSHTAKTPGPRGLQSPSRRRLSEDSKQHKIQPKVSPISSEKPGPSTAPPSEELPKQTHPPIDSSKQVENISTSEEKEVYSRAHDRIPPSLPDKEATEISEKAKTLIASKSAVSITRSALSLSRLLNDPSDVHRMIKSQKLRELLKQERTKEQKLKRAKLRQKEFTLDPAKMTMRDLIYYLPTTNPMMSSLEDPEAEDETVIPPLPRREEPKEREPVPEVPPVKVHSREEGDEEEEEGEEAADAEEDQEESLMVPQVKVAEDGSLIIDEESLTVEVQRAKGPNPASDRDPIFERGSTTTYSSFRRSTYVKPWTIEETDMFFLAVSMVGTDFSMICQLFPHRGRSEIKNKFKKEERENSWRIDKAFRERRKLDIEYFSKLLEKILEFQKDKKKLKSLAEKNAKKKPKAKAKAKKSAKNLSDVEEEDEVPDLEEGQEKENEDQFNEGETPSELKKKRKRKKKVEALTEEPDEKKNKTGEVPEDSEATLPESHTNSEMCENIPNVDTVKVTGVTPAKLPRARASQPLLPLGLKRGKKGKAEKTESAEGDKNTSDEAHKEQVDKDNLDTCKTSSGNSPGDDSSSEEEAAVKHQGPTRYGRVPKPTPAFAYACKEESHSSVAETTSASHSASKPKPKCAPKRGKSLKPQPDQKAKKPKLVTLRSSNSDFSDEEDDERQDPGCSSSKDMSSIMVDGLHTINTVISEVDDPMVELDILDSMPEMLGISQDALCPDSSCHQAQHETGTAEACDHQLDLLVDVIDFFTSDQLEASQDESYNEAAQTLLTICNAGHVSQSTQGEAPTQGSTSETSAIGETSDHHNENIVPTAQQQSPPSPLSAACPQKERGVSETVAGMDPQKSEMSSGNTSDVKTGEQMRDEPRTVHDEESDSHLKSKPQSSSSSSPSTKATRRPKVKAKPNIVRASRTAPTAAETTASKEQKAEESHVVTPVETPSAVEKSRPHTTGSDGALSGDGDPEVQPTEEKSVNSLIPQGCGFSLSQSESSRNEVSRDANPTDYKDVSTVPHGAGETELRNSLKSESEGEQVVQNQGSLSDPSQDSNSKHPPPEKSLSVNQKNTDTVAPRRSRLSKVKPNLPHMSRAALNKSQISKETVKKDSVTTLHTESQKQTIKDVETPSTSVKLTEELPAREVMEVDFGVAHQAEHQNTPEAQSTPEPQVERGSEAELSTAPEESCSPASRIKPVEDRPAEASTSRELRRSRFQKVKPKPNLTQTSRAMKTKPQSTGDAAMKSPGPTSESPTKSTVEVPLQTAGSATPEHQIAASGCSLSLNPILAPDSIHVSTEEQSANEKKTLPEPVDQVDMEAASTLRATENQNFIKAPVEQSKKQTSSDSELVSKLTDSDSISHNETSEISCNDTVTSDVSPTNFDPVQDQLCQPAVSVRPEEEPAVCKPDCETATADLPRRNRSSRVKPRPNIPQTSGAAKVKPQPSENRSEKNTNPQQSEAEPNPACSLSSEKQLGQGSNLNSGADLQRSDHPAAGITALELQVSPMEEKVPVPSAQQFKRSRTQKPKPNLSQTSRLASSKADEKCEVKPKLSVQQATIEKEKSSDKHASLTLQDAASKSTSVAPTVDSALTRFPEGTVSTIGASVQDQTKSSAALVGNLHASDQKDDKSNTGISAAMQLVTKHQSPNSEKVKEEENAPPNVEHISSSVVTEKTLPQRRQRFSKVKPKLNVEARCRVAARKLQSEDPSRPLEDQKHSLSPGRLEQKLDSATDTTSNNDPADPDCLSPGDCNLDVPLAVNILNTQTGAAPTAITDVPSASNASPSAHEKDSHEKDSPVRGYLIFSFNRALFYFESSDLTPSELNDSSKNSGKAPQASRGRLIKPKPNLRCSSRLQQARAVKNTSPAETDSGSASRALSTSGDKTLVSDRGAHTQEHEKEDFEKPSIKDSSSNDANSSRCCVEQGSSNEHKTSRTEGIQRDSLLSELVPEQVPSDPDEPFFILSLTEIPVSSAGEVEARAAENLAYLPATGGSGQQSSVSEVSLEAEEDHPECSVEPKASNVTQPDKPVGDGVTDKKTRLRSRAKVSASHVSETSVAKTRNPPCRKATSKRQRGKSPSAESQMSSSETKVSTSNFTIPTQTKSATSVDVHVGLSSASTSLHSPVGDGGLVDEEPTSVSQYFLSDIFTEVEEG